MPEIVKSALQFCGGSGFVQCQNYLTSDCKTVMVETGFGAYFSGLRLPEPT